MKPAAMFIAAVLSIAAIGTEGSEYVVQEPKPLSLTAGKRQDMRATELIGAKAVDLHGELAHRRVGRVDRLPRVGLGEPLVWWH